MVFLTELHKKRGFYTLPCVNRPINPRDPLGLWNVYYEERSELGRKKTQEEKAIIDQTQQRNQTDNQSSSSAGEEINDKSSSFMEIETDKQSISIPRSEADIQYNLRIDGQSISIPRSEAGDPSISIMIGDIDDQSSLIIAVLNISEEEKNRSDEGEHKEDCLCISAQLILKCIYKDFE